MVLSYPCLDCIRRIDEKSQNDVYAATAIIVILASAIEKVAVFGPLVGATILLINYPTHRQTDPGWRKSEAAGNLGKYSG